MTRDNITNAYFNWLSETVGEGDKHSRHISYRKLLMRLHDTEFRYSHPMDENRAVDGICLRYRFAREDDRYLEGPCSVLEMMVSLAIRCEETIMDDTTYGDRTSQWFWNMVVSLGLGGMTDANFDKQVVDDILVRFMDRCYNPDGRGGLFTVRDYDGDMRDIEIWHQLCAYLGTIT